MPDISFSPLEDVTLDTPGTADGTVFVSGDALGFSTLVGHGLVNGSVYVFGDAELIAYDGETVPVTPPTADGTVYAYGDSELFIGLFGDIDGTVYVFGETGSVFGADGTVYVSGEAGDSALPTDDYVFIVQPFPIIMSFVGITYEIMEDRLLLDSAFSTRDTAVLRSRVAIGATPRSALQAHVRGSDAIEFNDALGIIYHELIQISVDLGVSDIVDYRAMAIMVDRLLISGAASTELEARTMIASTLAFHDSLFNSWRDTMTDAVAIGVEQREELTAMEQMVDEALFGVQDESTATLHVLIPDHLEVGVEAITAVELLSVLRDEVNFTLRMFVDNGQYSAWTVNAATTAHTRYTNYPYNSFMQVGNKYYGTSEQGLFRLEGQTDNGAAIMASVRAGMSNLSSGNMKRIQSMYLGYKASGDMLVKVTLADDHNGQRETHTYRLVERGGESTRETRVPVGRGLQSVYWDYEIHNVDGAEFEVDMVEILPLISERRVRGSGGGKA